MRLEIAMSLLSLLLAYAATGRERGLIEKVAPAEVAAGTPFELTFAQPLSQLAVTVAAREVVCALAADGLSARCESPERIAPGLYEVAADASTTSERRSGRDELRIRLPRLLRALPMQAPVGALVRLELDARMPAEAEQKVFFADHWGQREARVLRVLDTVVEAQVPRAAPGPASEIWIEVGHERGAPLTGFRVIEPPRLAWQVYLPAAAVIGLALAALLARRRRLRQANPLDRKLTRD